MEELRKYLEHRISTLSKLSDTKNGGASTIRSIEYLYAQISAFAEIINYIDNIKTK